MIDQIYTLVSSTFANNEFLQGGFIIGLMGAMAVYCKQIPGTIWKVLKRRFLVECDIQQQSKMFHALVGWLSEQPYGKVVKRFSVTLINHETAEGYTSKLKLSPAPGNHWVRYKGRIIRIRRNREKMKVDNLLLGYHESITLQTLGNNRDFIQQLLNEILSHSQKRDSSIITIHTMDHYGNWDNSLKHTARSPDSLILDDNVKEDLINDIDNFLKDKQKYNNLGIPYRRGYLFHGAPGTGKSTASEVLAGCTDLDIATISMNNQTCTDTFLLKLIRNLPKKTILLIEDIDCLFEKDRTAKEKTGATLSGLLNALDGITAQEGHMIIMTTNHIDRLDPALIRPGRADVHVEFKLASFDQIKQMFFRFFPEGTETEANDFAHELGDRKVSPATVQGELMKIGRMK